MSMPDSTIPPSPSAARSRRAWLFIALAVLISGLVAVGADSYITSGQQEFAMAETAPSHTPTPTSSVISRQSATWTPTSMPGPPTLIAPEDGALLPQPVPPHQWHFAWAARYGPCWSSIWIRGPGGRSIWAEVNWWPNGYQYVYTQTEYLPDDALKPWGWWVTVDCPLGHNTSETRTFSVMPAAWFKFRFFMPILLKESGSSDSSGDPLQRS